jgi:hypothetical protein
MKLESLKSETKFTDYRIVVKCTGSFTIQSVTMNVYDARKSKTLNISTSLKTQYMSGYMYSVIREPFPSDSELHIP